MNSIQSMLRTEFYSDVTRNARFPFADYNKAFNDVIRVFINDQFGSEEGDLHGFQTTEQARSNLYTLIKVTQPTITTIGTINTRYGNYTQNHVDLPTDFYEFISIKTLIDGYSSYSRPTNYNKIGPLLENVFLKPTNLKTYYNEDSTGIIIYRGIGGTFTSIDLEYIRDPALFSVGDESSVIFPATPLVVGSSYIAIEDSYTLGSIFRPAGGQFTASNTVLSSGSVILASLTTPIDLPENTHETVAKLVSQLLLGVTGDERKSQFVEKQAAKQ